MDCPSKSGSVDAGQGVELLHENDTYADWLAWSPNSEHVAMSVRKAAGLNVWRPDTDEMKMLSGHSNQVTCVAWSRDGKRLASGSIDQTIRIWDPATSLPIRTLRGHSDTVTSVAWSEDGRQLASTAADDTVRIWDAEQPQSDSTFGDHTAFVWCLTWSPDGRVHRLR